MAKEKKNKGLQKRVQQLNMEQNPGWNEIKPKALMRKTQANVV